MRNDGNVLVVSDTAGRVLELVQLLVSLSLFNYNTSTCSLYFALLYFVVSLQYAVAVIHSYLKT